MPVPKLNECNGLIFTARTQEVRLFSQIRPKVQQLIIYISTRAWWVCRNVWLSRTTLFCYRLIISFWVEWQKICNNQIIFVEISTVCWGLVKLEGREGTTRQIQTNTTAFTDGVRKFPTRQTETDKIIIKLHMAIDT